KDEERLQLLYTSWKCDMYSSQHFPARCESYHIHHHTSALALCRIVIQAVQAARAFVAAAFSHKNLGIAVKGYIAMHYLVSYPPNSIHSPFRRLLLRRHRKTFP